MSSYLKNLNKYRNEYQISPIEYFTMVAHYPLFKLIWQAQYGSGLKLNIAKMISPILKYYKLSTAIPFGKQEIKFDIDFKSDSVASFKEIFLGGEYHVKNQISKVKTIVDLGSNTGMATIDFLTRFQPERILCVEGNHELISKLRKVQIQVGKKCDFVIENKCVTGNYNGPISFNISPDHRESRVVYGKEEGSLICDGVSLRYLLDNYDLLSVDLLKIDIEGGEYDILDKDGAIFKRFRDIIIEIHGDDNKRSEFRHGLIQLGFDLMETKPAPGCDCEISHFRRKEK